jgi:O-antigen/teichoic acid export membrane protein
VLVTVGDRFRNVGWAGLDQVASSATNFTVGLATARATTPEDFGAFATAWIIITFFVALLRASFSEPLLVRRAVAAAHTDAELEASGVTSNALIASAALGAAILICGIFLRDTRLFLPLFAVGIFLPGVACQDAARHILIAYRRPAAACVNDAAWGACLLATTLVLSHKGAINHWNVLMFWGGIGSVAGIVGILQLRARIGLNHASRFLRSNWNLIWRYATEYLTLRSSNYLVLVGIGIFGGISAIGAVRAAETLTGPLQVVYQAIPLMLLPQGAFVRRRGVRAINRLSRTTSTSVALLAGALLGLLWLLPSDMGRNLLGQNWGPAAALIPALWFRNVMTGWSTGTVLGLRILGDAPRSLAVRVRTAPLTILAGTLGAYTGGAVGAVTGLAVASTVNAVLFEHSYRQSLREPILLA